MVGHVERFNPAVLELNRIVEDLVHITAERISPYSARVQEGVVRDLMIHDIDIAVALACSPVANVQATTTFDRSPTEDHACALLRFANGITANITASRIGQQKIRRLGLIQRGSYVSVDLLRQDLTIHRVHHEEFDSSNGASYRQSGMVEIPFLEHSGEPLALEQQEFVQAILQERSPRVTARAALDALALADLIVAAAKHDRA